MSWFQTGLSSLSGQIGNFTREVLTEGTEEVEDYATQMKISKAKLSEAESTCSAQKKELDQLKKFTDELTVQLESKELQMQSVMTSFRESLSAKEKEMVALKKGELDLIESPHLPDSFNESTGEDLEDVLFLQHKVSSLQSKVSSLGMELRKYKIQNKGSSPGDDGQDDHSTAEEKIIFLQNKVKLLEKDLSDQLDRHQHELVSLQDSHSQNLASIKKTHVNSVELLKMKIQQLEKNLSEKDSFITNSEINNTRPQDNNGNIPAEEDEKRLVLEKLDHLERKNAKLEFDSAQVHAVDRKKTELIEQFQTQLDISNEDVRVLSDKLQKEMMAKEDLAKEFDLLLEENQTLMAQLNNIKLTQKAEEEAKKKKEMEDQSQPDLPFSSRKDAAEESLDYFDSKIIVLKKELMDAENDRIAESEAANDKIRRLEEELRNARGDLKLADEDSRKIVEEVGAKNSDLLAERDILKRKISELEEHIKELAENYAESQKIRGNIEAVLAMERRDRESGAVVERDLLKQKASELERELEKISAKLSTSEKSISDLESTLTNAKEKLKLVEKENMAEMEKVKDGYKNQIVKLKSQLSVSIEGKESEIFDDYKQEFEDLVEENISLKFKIKILEDKLECITKVGQDSVVETIAAADVIKFIDATAEKETCGDTDRSARDGESAMDELKKEIEELKDSLEQTESISKLYEAEVERLSRLEKDFEDLKKHKELQRECYVLMNNKEQINDYKKDKSDNITTSSSVIDDKPLAVSTTLSPPSSDPTDNEKRNETTVLKLTISRQEELIKTLNGKYSGVFKLLKDKSVELFGNEEMLSRLDRLQNEVESLRKEREHMISVLNDKTREGSSLKAEVHRLMDAIGAGKAALVKMQNDRVATTFGSANTAPTGGPAGNAPAIGLGEDAEERNDMKREAVKKLSQLIKDKDFEIDALNKKNSTLLQVLQTQSSESLNHEIKRLLMERDSLQKQASCFQFERDQLVNALNAKHSESLSYFDELNKQLTVIGDLNNQLENLERLHRSVTQQLEEKQASLIKLLDELSACKRRLAKTDGRKKNIERTLREEEENGETVDENDGGNSETKCSFIIGKSDDDDDVGDDDDGDKDGDAAKNVTEAEKPKREKSRNEKHATRKKMKLKYTTSNTDDGDDDDNGGDSSVAMGVVDKMMREKDMLIQARDKVISELKSKVLYFESEIVKLQTKLASAQSLIKQKDSDGSVSKKQVESLNFALRNEVTRRSEVEKDLEEIQARIESVTLEMNRVKQSNSFLTSNLNQKDFHLNSVKHELERTKQFQISSETLPSHRSSNTTESHQSQSSSIAEAATTTATTTATTATTAAAAGSDSGSQVTPNILEANDYNSDVQNAATTTTVSCSCSNSEVLERVTQEYKRREEELVRRMIMMQQEREQLYLALRYHQNETLEAKNGLSKLQDREKRLARECDRLRDHLVAIEEGYTKEALGTEEREKALRNQLAAAQDKIASLTNSVLSNRSDLSKQTENLQLQLHTMAEQRDNSLLQLSSAQETISSYSNSLSNLQMVLEQFQSEKINRQSLEVERFQMAFNKKQLECHQLQNQIQQLLIQLEDHSEAIKAAQRLSEQMDKKEHLISALREEVQLREFELKKTEDEITKLSSSTEAKVDKVLVKSLLIGYFHVPASKRLEAFKVIGHILNFSSEELKNIGMSGLGSGGWIEGIFRKKSSSSSTSSSSLSLKSQQPSLNHSFSELFVSFLERESTPHHSDPSKLRLPAERMVAEQQQKRHQDPIKPRTNPTFNPFSTPISNPILPSFSQSLLGPLRSDKGASSSTLFEQPSPLLTSQVVPSGGSNFYPAVVAAQSQGSRERPQLRESFVPIVLAAAAAVPSVIINNNNNNIKNNKNK